MKSENMISAVSKGVGLNKAEEEMYTLNLPVEMGSKWYPITEWI